jgi:hypothetical protein
MTGLSSLDDIGWPGRARPARAANREALGGQKRWCHPRMKFGECDDSRVGQPGREVSQGACCGNRAARLPSLDLMPGSRSRPPTLGRSMVPGPAGRQALVYQVSFCFLRAFDRNRVEVPSAQGMAHRSSPLYDLGVTMDLNTGSTWLGAVMTKMDDDRCKDAVCAVAER